MWHRITAVTELHSHSWHRITAVTELQSHTCHRVTESHLSHSHTCHRVTPVTESHLSQSHTCHACHRVTPVTAKKLIIQGASFSMLALFEGTWWSAFRVIIIFRSYESSYQFPVNKRMIKSPLHESWILKPEALNPEFESIIKQTKYFIPISLSLEFFKGVWLFKAKTGH